MDKKDVMNLRDAFEYLRLEFPDIVFPEYDYSPLVNVLMAYTPRELAKMFNMCLGYIAEKRMNAYRNQNRDFIIDSDTAFEMTTAMTYAALSIPWVDPQKMHESMNRQMDAGVGAAFVSEFAPKYGKS